MHRRCRTGSRRVATVRRERVIAANVDSNGVYSRVPTLLWIHQTGDRLTSAPARHSQEWSFPVRGHQMGQQLKIPFVDGMKVGLGFDLLIGKPATSSTAVTGSSRSEEHTPELQ